MQGARCFELRTESGAIICRLMLVEEAMSGERTPSDAVPGKKAETRTPTEADSMTSPQKRMLFRLMVTRGLEGERAHEELKRRFRVKSLNDVSKFDASRMIEQLIAEKGGDGHGPSLE